ncbi:MAG: AAA family ATPase [Sphingomonas sp.]
MKSPEPTNRTAAIDALLDGVFDSVQLDAIRFPPIRYLVDGYVAEGATLLAGAPKIGKSWMAMNIAYGVATGQPVFGTVPTRQGDVLYIALEDNPRRLQRRQAKMGAQPSPHLNFHTRWMMLDEGAIEAMDVWIPHCRHQRSLPDKRHAKGNLHPCQHMYLSTSCPRND